MIGVQLLSQLTCEMNQISDIEANRSLTKHRKIASSFRDSQLFEIFRLWLCVYCFFFLKFDFQIVLFFTGNGTRKL